MRVPVSFMGSESFLTVDTGSTLTFLHLGSDGPAYVADAGEAVLGCERLRLPGRNFAPDAPGLVGVLGADLANRSSGSGPWCSIRTRT